MGAVICMNRDPVKRDPVTDKNTKANEIGWLNAPPPKPGVKSPSRTRTSHVGFTPLVEERAFFTQEAPRSIAMDDENGTHSQKKRLSCEYTVQDESLELRNFSDDEEDSSQFGSSFNGIYDEVEAIPNLSDEEQQHQSNSPKPIMKAIKGAPPRVAKSDKTQLSFSFPKSKSKMRQAWREQELQIDTAKGKALNQQSRVGSGRKKKSLDSC